MPHYPGCRVVAAFDDGRPAEEDDDAELRLDDGELLLAYWDERGAVVLAGAEAEPGTFEWMARSRPRHGTLRRESAQLLVGRWSEGQECGTLRVELPATPSDPEAEED